MIVYNHHIIKTIAEPHCSSDGPLKPVRTISSQIFLVKPGG